MKSEEETIADMLELGLSHGKYQALLNKLKASSAVCYPSLEKVKAAKKKIVSPWINCKARRMHYAHAINS